MKPHKIKILEDGNNDLVISSRYFIIATGSSPVTPPVPGLEGVPYLTNETLFALRKLPARLAVLGAGPVGIEMAQAFRRLGSEVAVFDLENRILPREDPELAMLLHQCLDAEGIEFVLGGPVKRVRWDGNGYGVTAGTSPVEHECDALLVAAGRKPNLCSLNLEAAGVVWEPSGVVVNKHCRTTAKHIYACGDATGLYQLTHMSEHMAKVAVSAALLHLRSSVETRCVPRCIYTDPELARVGASEDELRRARRSYTVYPFPYSKIDRAITDGATTGLIKVLARKLDGKIYGASILGANAGEMIGEFALAMKHGISLRGIANTIHAYPTYVLGDRRAADQWYVRKQSRNFVRLLRLVYGYRGQLPDTSDPNRIV